VIETQSQPNTLNISLC